MWFDRSTTPGAFPELHSGSKFTLHLVLRDQQILRSQIILLSPFLLSLFQHITPEFDMTKIGHL